MVKFFKILSQNPSQTKKIAKILAREFLKTQTKKALVLGLIGDLGGGKTTFLQGFAKGLAIKEKILSPSFVIIKKYKLESRKLKVESRKKFKKTTFHIPHSTFYHIDCYRIEKPKEILDLGFKEIISDPKNIVAIEWADRIKKILPQKILILKFDFVDQTQREIEILNYV